MTALFVVYISLGKPQRTNQRYLPHLLWFTVTLFMCLFLLWASLKDQTNWLGMLMQLRYFCFAGQFATGHQKNIHHQIHCRMFWLRCHFSYDMELQKKRCASYTGFFEKHFLNKQNWPTNMFYAKSTLGSYNLSSNFWKVNVHVQLLLCIVISWITAKTA